MRLRRTLLVLFALAANLACASGPRFVTGPPYFTGSAGRGIGWRQANLAYFTDPGALSPSMNHAAADALVASAAAVWNVPVAGISLSRGGVLAEHVDGEAVYLSSDGLVWPADVEAANASAIALAVVYDTDGSVTDTLLGAGASDPGGCQQNAVTETVDAFDPAGYITHAVIVLNGRCTGTAPEQQLQLEYQLVRVFGRVLGLAWSQANENVFTGTPTPTFDQAMHWPIMHPIDILCGPYSYQCLPQPFVLRPDDLAGLVGLYPIAVGTTPPAGKQVSLTAANSLAGTITFPGTEGMEGLNVVVKRQNTYTSAPLGWIETSAVTGATFRRADRSPFVAADPGTAASMGTTAATEQGLYTMPYIEIIDRYGIQSEVISSEPINPLYIGSLSVGAYAPGMVAPAGSGIVPYLQPAVAPLKAVTANFLVSDAPAACNSGTDGTAAMPLAVAPTGWWNGLLCGYGHAAYTSVPIRAGRSLTVEVTALDASGFATTGKAMPVIGLFAPSDAAGSLPSLGVTPSAFQSIVLGTTTLSATPFAAGSADSVLRLGIADQRGDGRPDFTYQARLFYADSVAPQVAPIAGAALSITGRGFRQGLTVTINGVPAHVQSATATAIAILAPAMALAGATANTPVDIEVTDPGTGADSVMTAALTYSDQPAPGKSLRLVSAPAAPLSVGDVSTVPFAVQALSADGETPLPGETVLVSSAAASFAACRATTCSLVTGADGVASTAVTPSTAGSVKLSAADGTAALTTTFVAQSKATQMNTLKVPAGTLLPGKLASPVFMVQELSAAGRSITDHTVVFSVAPGSTGAAIFNECNATPCSAATNVYGQALASVMPTRAGTLVLLASDGNLSQTVTLTVADNTERMTSLQLPTTPTYVTETAGNFQVKLTAADGVTPLVRANVTFSAPAGVVFTQCQSRTCVIATDSTGVANTGVTSTATGTYSVQATYLSASVSSSMTVNTRQLTLSITSAPSGNVPLGTWAATPFSARLMDSYGKPKVGATIVLGAALDQITAGCGQPSCELVTDGTGTVTTTIMPLKPGPIVLEAAYLNLNQTATFTGVGTGETFQVLSAPPAQINIGDPATFKLRGLAVDGVSPVVRHTVWVTVTLGNLAITGCAQGLCKFYTDSGGYVTINGTASVEGAVNLSASLDGIVQSATFNVVRPGHVLKVVAAPSGNVMLGNAASAPFTVQLFAADGVTPSPRQNVLFTLASGSAGWTSCRPAPCVVVTDANGLASTGAITPTAAGSVSLVASSNSLSATAGFRALSNVDTVSLAGAPVSVFQDATASVPFAVLVTLSDGVTPAPGIPVSLATANGGVLFAACNSAACTLSTNALGRITTGIQGVKPGNTTLTATVLLSTGNQSVAAPFTVLANVRAVTAGEGPWFVGEGATLAMPLDLVATQNGLAAAAQAVAWTGASGFTVAGSVSTTDSAGRSTMQSRIGPLTAGTSATVSACLWSTTCARYTASGISSALWQLSILSGGLANASGGAALPPVIVQVVDGAGHALSGVTVSVGQTATAVTEPCPTLGRCPAAPVIASATATLVSDLTGRVAITPLVVAGRATSTAIACSAGTRGFATTTVTSSP